MKTYVAILAGGIGARMGSALPKQFITVGDRCIIEYTIDAFDRSEEVDEIIVIVHPDWLEHMEYLISCNRWTKCKRVVPGGKERYESTLNALKAFPEASDEDKILLHDAVRPLVSNALIEGTIAALDECEAAGVAVACTDTVWRVVDGIVESIPERKSLMRAQTPQGFRFGIIKSAYRKALEQGEIAATDDCGMVSRYMPETRIHIVEGDERNIKITYPQDLSFLENYLKTI